jgi:hypothetical protein
MEDEEYELVSREEVSRLKSEVERLKSNPFVKNAEDTKLYEAVQDLNNSVNRLFVLFESINRQLLKEYQESGSPDQKLDKVLEQNRSIAEALVAIGSKLDGGAQAQAPQMPSFVQQPLPVSQPTPSQPPLPPPQQQDLFSDQVAFQGFKSSMGRAPGQQVQQAPGQQGQQFLDPNYPVPDRFQAMNGQPGMGAPLDVQPKKRGLFGRK